MINTYQIQINESAPLGQSIISLLRSASGVVSFNPARNAKVLKSLKSGFKDVREIIDGKQERTTIDEFINELRNNTN
jgi:Zn-dependent M16 (insulinase) family peptidase